MVLNQTIQLESENDFLLFAANFSKKLLTDHQTDVCTIFLEGELGAGKTTFVRGFLRGLGYLDPVKSPTYTFVESYELANKFIHHFDLYRLPSPDALEARGLRDYFIENTVCLIEWPSRGGVYLPQADVHIDIKITGKQRCLEIYSHD